MALKVHAGVRPQSKVLPSGVRRQSKVARDCTLAPDPRAAPDRGLQREIRRKKSRKSSKSILNEREIIIPLQRRFFR